MSATAARSPSVDVEAAEATPGAPSERVVRRAVASTLRAAGVPDGHLAVTFAGPARMRRLNRAHRGIDAPTDVLSFPIDERGPAAGPRELGDVVICPELCADPMEAIVHGVLHLAGHDHETDDGAMLAVQDRVVASLG